MSWRFVPFLTLVSFLGTPAAFAQIPTTLTLVPSPNPSTFGASVTLTATITPSAATGLVTFFNGTTILGDAPLSAAQATLSTVLLPADLSSLHAYYIGSLNYGASLSPAVAQTVNSVAEARFVPAPGSPFTEGLSPEAVAVADINGDGKPDLILVNPSSDAVTVLIGVGNGTFTIDGPFTAGAQPYAVTVADFNGDGFPDLAIANSADSTVTVLLGNGTGGFAPATGSPFAVGSESISIAVGDFNGDGIADLAVGNYGDNTVTVLIGNGSGGFTPATASPFTVGTNPYALAVGDFNGDGKADLAVVNSGDDTVTVLIGNGSGGFTATANPSAVGRAPVSVVVADFNGDGKADLAVANFIDSAVTVLIGDGTGGFTAATGSPVAVGTNPYGLAVGDFNADGSPDLAVTNAGAGSVTVLLWNGSGGFTALGSPATVGTGAVSIVAADFNGDGRPDLAVANKQSNNVSVLLGEPAAVSQTINFGALTGQTLGTSPVLSATASSGLAVTFTWNTTSVCTVSGNVVTLVSAGTCSITALQPGNSVYAAAPPVTQMFLVSAPAPQTSTVTVVAPTPNPSTYGHAVTLTATVTPAAATGVVTFYDGATMLGSATLSGGQAVLSTNALPADSSLLWAYYGGSVGYVASTSATVAQTVNAVAGMGFNTATGNPFGTGTEPASLALADFNGDGKADLAVANYGDSTVTVLVGNGNGGFTATGIPIAVGTNPYALVAGDFNGDGKADLAVANFADGTVTELIGNGNGGFTPAPGSPFPVGKSPSNIAVGDFNGDGKADLVTTNYGDNTITVMLGNGSGGFAAAPGSPFTVGTNPYFVAVGDFNGDGKPDLAVANYGDDTVTVMAGNGSGGFAAVTGSPFMVGNGPVSVAVADFNGDGKADLAVANFADHTITVLIGSGSGGFAASTGSPFGAGNGSVSIGVGDFDGDGKTDLAIANFGEGTVTELIGNGSGGFTAGPGNPFQVGSEPNFVVVGDFNGDGRADIAVADYGASNVTVLLGAVPLLSQTITFGPLSNQLLSASPITVSAMANSGLTVTFASNTTPVCTVSGVTVTLVIAGMCSITASQAGNSVYAAATPVTQTFTVSTATAQTITFGPLGTVNLSGSPIMLSATATSGLTVIFASNTLPVCTVSVVTVTLVKTGICSITASQAGNGTYAAATPVTQTFFVANAQPVAAFLDQNGAPALTFNGSMNFPDAGGFLTGAPGVAQAPDGDVYIVGLDSAGGVHLNSYSYANTAWNGWQYSGGILDNGSLPGHVATGLTAAVDPSGVVWFTGRDIGNRYWINSWNGTSFGGWILMDGAVQGVFAGNSIPQIAIPSDGSIYVIGTDIGNRVWSTSYIPATQTFTGFVDRQGVIVGQPSATAGQDGMVYVVVRSVASESPVYITQIPANNGPNNPNVPSGSWWINGGGQIDTDPQIASVGGKVYIAALADGGTVYLDTFLESNQTFGGYVFTGGILNDITIADQGGNVYIAGRDGSDRIYWYSATGNSFFLAGGAGVSSTVLAGAK